jgi:hypothetical protein
MSDTNDNDKLAADGLPEVFTRDAHVIAAARKGMGKRAIAARARKQLRDWEAFLVSYPALALQIEEAYADYEEAKRARREYAAQKAEEEGNWSLVYKEAHDALETHLEQDNRTAVVHATLPEEGAGNGEFSLSVVIAKANRDPSSGVTLGDPTITPLNTEKGRDVDFRANLTPLI